MNVQGFLQDVSAMWKDLPNAILAFDRSDTQQVFRTIDELTFLPRMSTIHIGILINRAVSWLDNGECYLNIGIWNGYSLFAGALGNPSKSCIGVDNFSTHVHHIGSHSQLDRRGRDFGNPKNTFYRELGRLRLGNVHLFEMDCQQFLRGYPNYMPKHIGVFYYDADHREQEQLEALKLVEPYLSPRSILIIDDYNRWEVARAVETWLASNLSFSKILVLETPANHFPTWWNGLVIIARR